MAVITIGGNIGAGKTVLAKRLADVLGWEEFYVGGIFRSFAAERGVPIGEFYASLANDPNLERAIDERQVELMKEKSDLVVQGRIAWYFAEKNDIPSVDILLMVDPEIGADRKKKQEGIQGSIDKVAAMHRKREWDEWDHYKSLYGIKNHLDPAHYDIILDTSRFTEDAVFQKIFAELSVRIKK